MNRANSKADLAVLPRQIFIHESCHPEIKEPLAINKALGAQ